MSEKMNPLIITGSAPCVNADIASVPGVCGFDYMVIGFAAAGMHTIHSKYMATYHPTMIPDIKTRRESIGGNTDYIVISHIASPGVDIVEPLLPGERSGSSALLGALAAIKLGYNRIVLCGCPLIGNNDKGGPYESFQVGWENKKKYLNDRVRSMGGWTQQLLGAPTEKWLLGEKT
jgi:hypothetical protein